MNFHKLLAILISLLFSAYCSAQVTNPEESPEISDTQKDDKHKDQHSPDSALVQYYYLNNDASYTIFNFSKPLHAFQEYKTSLTGNRLYANTGNVGSASSPLFYNFNTSPEFKYKTDIFELYRLNIDSIRIYESESPFSHIKYILGKAKEQRLDFELNQRLGPGLYTGITLRYANAPGNYLRQRTYYPGGTIFVAYTNPSKRYKAILTFLSDKFTNYENGGLQNPNVFLDNEESNRKTILINLEKAYSASKIKQFNFQHSYKLSEKKPSNDTIIEKSRTFDIGQIVHNFRFSSEGNSFSDRSSNFGFYPQIFADSSNIFDTVNIRRIENTFAYTTIVPDTSANAFPFQYSLKLKNSLCNMYTDSATNNFFQLIPMVTLKGIIGTKTFFKADGALSIGGYNNGDFVLTGSFYQYFGKNNNIINLIFSQSHNHPEYFFTKYATNTFDWDKNFKPIDITKAGLDVMIRGYRIRASVAMVYNYVYLDKTITPVQHEKVNLFSDLNFTKRLTSRHWNADLFATVQKSLGENIISLPLITGKAIVYYDIVLFNKALHAQIGLSAIYHTKWNPQAYMPALNYFYEQDEFSAGNYPYADVFINLNVKRARMFFKYEHFNSMFSGYQYMIIPGYPQDDAGFKFGISWVFFD